MKNWASAVAIALAVALFAMPVLPAQQPTSPSPAPFQIHFFAQVDYSSVNQLIAVVDQQLKLGTKDFYLLIASPGGDPTAGLAAYNYLHNLNANITTFNLGDVDSAANISTALVNIVTLCQGHASLFTELLGAHRQGNS